MDMDKVLDNNSVQSNRSTMPEETADVMEEFVALLAQHDRSLTLYVISLCPNVNEADDILQDVKMVLWQKFDHFEAGTSFIAWARKIAFFKVLSYRKKKSKAPYLADESILMEISDDAENRQQIWHNRGLALDNCVGKMKEEQREILQMRYKEQMGIEAISEKLGRTQQAVYRQLSRLRQQLLECVRKNPVGEEE